MSELWLTIAREVIMALLGIGLLALSTIGGFYIKRLMTHLEEKELIDAVRRYVRWVEQSPGFKDWTGEEKFAMVMNTAYQWLEDRGLTVDQDEVAAMIEEAVLLMKEAAAPILSD